MAHFDRAEAWQPFGTFESVFAIIHTFALNDDIFVNESLTEKEELQKSNIYNFTFLEV